MVLLKQIHHGVKVGHVLTNQEREMTSMDLLVVDNVVTNLVPSPLSINLIGQGVLNTFEHGDRDSADVGKRDQVSLPLLVPLKEVIVVVGVDLEAILPQVLRIV